MRNVLIATLTLALPATAQQEPWLTDFDAAKATAKKGNKLILANFTGSDWCKWCVRLKDEVFDTPEFEKWARQNVVLLEVDFPRGGKQSRQLQKRNKELAVKFNVRGYPTILFLDADGEQVGRMGYEKGGAAKWIKLAEEQMQPVTSEAEESPWMTDYQAALNRAKKEGKPILADFTGSDWCKWCVRLKDEVFDTPEFEKWAEKNVVLLELDYPRSSKQSKELETQNKKLKQKYAIASYPTILFLDARGQQIGKMGYARGGPKVWLAKADRQIAKTRSK